MSARPGSQQGSILEGTETEKTFLGRSDNENRTELAETDDWRCIYIFQDQV